MATPPGHPHALGDAPPRALGRHDRVRGRRLPVLPAVEQPLLHLLERRRDRDHGAPAHPDRRDRGDRPLGRLDARPVGRPHGRALQARLADLAGDDRGGRPRRVPRRGQRLPRDPRRLAVARGHDRDADALPRHRAGNPADGHDRRLPDQPREHRRRPDPPYAYPLLDRVLRCAGDRLRRRPPCDAARARDLRDRRGPGGSLLRGHPRQADQVLVVRPLRDAERIRRRAVVASLRIGPLRLRRRHGALRRHDRAARRRLDLRRSRHDRRRCRGCGRSRLSSDGSDGRPHCGAGPEHRGRRSSPRERDRSERRRSVSARSRAAAHR